MNKNGVLAPGYMKRFRCIGGACEASCCQWWRIDIDRENYKSLKKAMATTAAEREKFRKAVKRNRAETNQMRYFAKIVLEPDTNFCPFVDPRGLCEIHSRYGEDYLSLTCRTYPRTLNDIFGHFSLGAVLSCPEVARQCLLDPEGTTPVLLESEEAKTAGLALAGRCDDASDPYCRYVNEIRDILFQFLSARQYPVSHRLFFVAYLGHRISSLFYRNMKEADFDENLLAAEVERLSDPGMLDELSQRYHALEASMELPLKFINSILSAQETNPISGSLFQDIFGLYGLDGEDWDRFLSADEGVSRLSAGKVIETYRIRRDRVKAAFSEGLEISFENFCKNHLFVALHTDSPSLLEYIENMVFKLAIGAFVLFSHPGQVGLLESYSQNESKQETENFKSKFDVLVVESFFKFSRSIEHDKKMWESVRQAIGKGNLSGLPYIVQLLKFMD